MESQKLVIKTACRVCIVSVASDASNWMARNMHPTPETAAMSNPSPRLLIHSATNPSRAQDAPINRMVSYKVVMGGRCMMMQRITTPITARAVAPTRNSQATPLETFPNRDSGETHVKATEMNPNRNNHCA